MKYCINCGTELDDDALFCTECGCPVEEENESPASTVNLSKPTDVLSPDDEESASDRGETGIPSYVDIFGIDATLIPSDGDETEEEEIDVPSDEEEAEEEEFDTPSDGDEAEEEEIDVPSDGNETDGDEFDLPSDVDEAEEEEIDLPSDEDEAVMDETVVPLVETVPAATDEKQDKKTSGAGRVLVTACLCLLTFVLGIGVGVGIGRHYSAVSGSDLVSPADIVITAQPTDAQGCVEDAISFQVKAEGDNLAYQWYYKKQGDGEFTAWDKSTKSKATSKVYASWNGAEYYCEITDGHTTVRTDTVHLTVLPKIILQPVNQIGSVGKTVTFDLEATGAGLKYQWYYKKPGAASWTRWNKRTKPSATTNVYASWDNTEYYCEITDANGNTLKSDTVRLIID